MDREPDALDRAIAAYHARDFDTALRGLLAIVDEEQRPGTSLQPPRFIVMFTWTLLAEEHAPARHALAAHRDEHVRLLLAGDVDTVGHNPDMPGSRFSAIVSINDTLGDTAATYALFKALLDARPEHAQRQAWRALPAIVAAGDFALAERYMPDPLARLAELNGYARTMPLFPPEGAAPRLAAELSNYVQDVWLRAAILEGLGREEEARRLRNEAIAGIESEELRELAQRGLASPGAIHQAVTEHEIRHHDADRRG